VHDRPASSSTCTIRQPSSEMLRGRIGRNSAIRTFFRTSCSSQSFPLANYLYIPNPARSRGTPKITSAAVNAFLLAPLISVVLLLGLQYLNSPLYDRILKLT
jgi:hypothetical protein